MRTRTTLRTLLALVALGAPTFGAPVLVSQSPFSSTKQTIMETLFGFGNVTVSSDFDPSTAGLVFTDTNRFVWLHGGEDDFANEAWHSYINLNTGLILDWVTTGGALLLESDGFSPLTTALGPGSLAFDAGSTFTTCGNLTTDGAAALPNSANPTCGDPFDPLDPLSGSFDLGVRRVDGAGLMVLVYNDLDGLPGYNSGSDMAVVAGTRHGNGYIMYSGLTNSAFHADLGTLVSDMVAFTEAQATDTPIPEPGTLGMLAAGLIAAAIARRRMV